jgi:RimJ/RimL family protein N-acetyltransferase
MDPLTLPVSFGANGIRLRLWEPRDVRSMTTWGDDPMIVRFTGVPAVNTPAIVLRHASEREVQRQAGMALRLMIVDHDDTLLGSCDVRRLDPADPAFGEIGYLVLEQARGRGVATTAVQLLVDYSFQEMGLQRIQALVHPDNPGSGRVLERAGFRREGLLRGYRPAGDRREDRVLYSIVDTDPRSGMAPG